MMVIVEQLVEWELAGETEVLGGSFPGVKWQGREADHSPPVSAEVKKMWIHTSTP
jgi:hypothetical protein